MLAASLKYRILLRSYKRNSQSLSIIEGRYFVVVKVESKRSAGRRRVWGCDVGQDYSVLPLCNHLCAAMWYHSCHPIKIPEDSPEPLSEIRDSQVCACKLFDAKCFEAASSIIDQFRNFAHGGWYDRLFLPQPTSLSKITVHAPG
jgi:hypothetical protein